VTVWQVAAAAWTTTADGDDLAGYTRTSWFRYGVVIPFNQASSVQQKFFLHFTPKP